jgi:F1F0 ATPase subunit 2
MIIPIFTGFLLGLIFYLGLWFTIQKGLASPLAAVWFFSSMLLRTSLVMTGMYWIGRGDWHAMLECLGGFTLGRVAINQLMRTPNTVSNFLLRLVYESKF